MLIASGADIAAISRQMGHANIVVTLGVYGHWFAKRSVTGLGAALESFLTRERGEMVASGPARDVSGYAG